MKIAIWIAGAVGFSLLVGSTDVSQPMAMALGVIFGAGLAGLLLAWD